MERVGLATGEVLVDDSSGLLSAQGLRFLRGDYLDVVEVDRPGRGGAVGLLQVRDVGPEFHHHIPAWPRAELREVATPHARRPIAHNANRL
ncbi:MAG TPA: hypothetical protein QGH10_00975, partial [Armatimonadota bacterium]|nr:hypothetical protein [Armatimonadota bacterium]